MTDKVPVTFMAGCAIEADYLFVAAKPDVLDDEEDLTRLFYYDAQQPQPWVHHDLPDRTVLSLAVMAATKAEPRRYVALSNHGEVEIEWPGGSRTETIAGAGLKGAVSPVYGYVNTIREIGGKLHVCGSGGQVYRRDSGGWTHLADSLRSPPTADPDAGSSGFFHAIAGHGGADLYVGGSEIVHFDGTTWRTCDSPSDADLLELHCGADGIVWACGLGGTILRGNAERGFELIAQDEETSFTAIESFGNKLYFGSERGVSVLDPVSGVLADIDTRLPGGVTDVGDMSQAGGILWVFGAKDIVSFDGRIWSRLEHPDNA